MCMQHMHACMLDTKPLGPRVHSHSHVQESTRAGHSGNTIQARRQSKNLLKCYLDMEAYEVRMVHVDPSLISIDEVREDMRKALMDPTARIMVNVDRRAMGQIGGGHFSPLGSYVAREDSFLFMDVAKYKYPPVWVTAARLYASLATVDQCGSWDFPSGQDSLPHVDPMKVYRNRTLYAEMLKRVNCKETYRGYIIVRLKR